jgi:tetratricopeptide (TPR) repeat protein
LSNLGRAEEAIQSYRDAIDIDPECVGAIMNMSGLLFEHGELTEALSSAQKALKLYSQMGRTQQVHQAEHLINQIQKNIANKNRPGYDLSDNMEVILEVFIRVDSFAAMQLAVKQYPFLAESSFIQTQQSFMKSAAPEARFEIERRLNWLHQIDGTQELGYFDHELEKMQDLQQTIEYYEESLFDAHKKRNRREEGSVLGRLGNAYADFGETHKAIECYEKQLKIAREIGDQLGEGNSLGNLGIAYAELGDIRQAFKYCELAIPIRRKIGDLDGTANDLFNMARLYSQQGEDARALSLAQEAENIWTQIGNPNAQRAQELIAQLQEEDLSTQTDPFDFSIEAFHSANNLGAMQQVVKKYPFMMDDNFIQAMEEFMKEDAPLNLKPVFEKRLVWLKQIAGKQNPGFLGRLFGRK